MRIEERVGGGIDITVNTSNTQALVEEVLRLNILIVDLRKRIEALPRGEIVSSGYAMSDPLVRTPAVSVEAVLAQFPTPGKFPALLPDPPTVKP